jgi:RNA polymerase sigma-70 factor (ECF subfamily)
LLDTERESLFRSWLAGHSAAILKVARSYAQTPDDVHDLSQEILLQLWRSLPQFNGEASALTWCYRVALNTALSWRRNEGRRRVRRQPLGEVNNVPAPGPDGAEQTAQRELVERLYVAIRQLSATDSALVLLYLDDLSYRQIADVLGISENHVGVKLNRARKALAQLLHEESDEP